MTTRKKVPAPPPISPADFEQVARLLHEQQWIFAKTMAHNPHHYTLRRNWTNDADFVWTVETIRRHGYRQKYGKAWYTVLDVNDHFYWTMGWPVGSLDWGWERLNKAGTILINRKPLARAATDAVGTDPVTRTEREVTPKHR